MDDGSKIRIVTFRFSKPAQPGLRFGYLVCDPDGKCWCYQNEEAARRHDVRSGAIQLDRWRLQEQSDSGADRKLYLYLGDVVVPQKGTSNASATAGDISKPATAAVNCDSVKA